MFRGDLGRAQGFELGISGRYLKLQVCFCLGRGVYC